MIMISRRLTVTPGCTGIWQVSGRNNLGFKEMVELDLKYISERNIWMDIKIILKTILVIIWFKECLLTKGCIEWKNIQKYM